jgi:PAS domain S-box-containing protein
MPDFNKINAYSEFFEFSNEPFVILDFQLNFLVTNPSWSNTFSWEREYPAGKSFLEFVVPKDQENIENILSKLKLKSNSITCKLQNTRKEKDEILFEWRFVSNTDSEKIYCYGRDLRSRINAERKIQKYESAFDNSDWGLVFSQGHSRRIESVNQYFADLVGYSKEELAGKLGFELFPDEFRKELAEAIKKAEEIGHNIFLTKIEHKDKNRIDVMLNISFVEDEDGNKLQRVINIQDMTDLLKHEHEYSEINERLMLALKTARIGVWDRDLITEEIFFDQNILSIYEVDRIDNLDHWYERLHPEDAQWMKENLAEFNKKEQYELEFRIFTPDGKLKWIRSLVKAFKKDGEPYRLLGVNEDISESKNASLNLIESQQRFQKLIESVNGVYWINDVEKQKSIYISPRYENIWGRSIEDLYKNPAEFIDAIHPEDQPTLFQAYEQIAEIQKIDLEYRIIKPSGEIRWIWARANVSEDVNGRLLEFGYAEDITERKNAENIVLESERKYRTLTDESPFGIAVHVGGIIKFFNKYAAKVFDISSADQLLERNIFEIIHPDYIEKTKERLSLISGGETVSSTRIVLKKPGGGEFVAEILGMPIEFEGKEAVQVIFRDIEKQVAIEIALKETEELSRQILENTQVIIILSKVSDGEILYANNKLYEYLGIKDELIGRNMFQYYHDPEDAKKLRKLLSKHGIISNFNLKSRTESGELKYISLSATLIKYKGEEAILSSVIDITEQKLAEQDLIINELHFEEAQNIADIGSWVLELDTMKFTASNHAHTIFGFQLNQIIEVQDFAQKVHSGDRDNVLKRLEGAIGNPEIKYDIKYRIYHSKGEKYIHAIGEVLRDGKGNPLKMIGIVQDITKQQLAQQELKDSKTRIEKAQRITHYGDWHWNVKTGDLIWADEMFEMYGLDPETTIADYDAFFNPIHPDDKKMVQKAVEDALSNPDYNYNLVYRILLKGGELKYLHTQGEVEWNEKGEAVFMVGIEQDVTSQVLAEKEIESKNKELDQILQTSNEGYILVDNNNIIQNTNEAFCTMIGYDNSEVINSENIFYISEAMKQEYATKSELLARGKSLIFQIDMISASGKIVHTIHSSVPSHDSEGKQAGSFTFITDISPVKEIETKLRTSYEEVNKYKKAIDLTTITSTIDLNGIIRNVNDNYLTTYHLEWDEIIGRNMNVVESGHHPREFWETMWETILGGNVWQGEVKNKTKNGNYVWTKNIIIPIKDESEKVIEFLLIAHNITENKNAEQEIKNLNQHLEDTVIQRTQKLIDLNDEKDNFLGMVSHDLKNPLSGILLYSELILKKSTEINNDSILRSTKQIVKATERMNHIIESILNISNVESGQIQLKKEPFNLNKLLLETAQHYSQKCKEKDQTIIITEITENYLVENDISLITQIFDNLISNAIKYSENGKRIWINQRFSDDKIIVEIKDEGLGISSKDKDRVFVKFSKLGSRPTAGESSTGLGLSIVKQLANIVGGRVWFESEENEGTSFYVELKINQKI